MYSCRIVTIHLLLGAALGMLLLHPIVMSVVWGELRFASVMTDSLWTFVQSRFESVFTARVLPMTFGFAVIGGAIGWVFALYHLALSKQFRAIRSLSKCLADDLPTLIGEGESAQLEFKSSVRWDFHKEAINRSLEVVIAKTIAGFMNHRGGSLIIGVTDAGEVVGLQKDYLTLKHKNRDGFERCIMDIVNNKIGGDKCAMVRCVFHDMEGQDVCRVLVGSSREPVYVNDGPVARYFVRSGNSTRELDAREALAHISQR